MPVRSAKGGRPSAAPAMSIELERLFRAAPHPYLVVSPQLRVVDVNACYLSTLRTQREALLGRPVVEAVARILRDPSGDLSKDLRTSLERVVRGAQSDRLGVRRYELQGDGSGTTRSLRLCNTPLLDEQGALASILHSVEVLTDPRPSELCHPEDERLRLARAEAEAASSARSEFLASMSHELRTPMNSILGFAQLLMRDAKERLSARHRERVGHILQSGEHLLRLIDDVLDLARIESGRVPVSMEPVSLHELLPEAIRALAPMAREHNLHLEAAPLDTSFPHVLGDRARVLQILINFGSNAIKYNRPQGRVMFSAHTREAAIRVQVADTGMGIAAEQQSKLFQAFQRAGQEAGPIAGTGIGLLITKKLAELMDGRVGFDSTPGVGSLFWLELPLIAASIGERGGDSRPVSAPPLAPGVVLYVEDNPANVAFMCDLFDDLEDMTLVTARSAAEGLVLTRVLRPQVVLMDINLPDMSGSHALQALKLSPETASIPVIALTATASERDRTAGLQAGFYRYLTKPLDVEELMKALYSALRHAASRPPDGRPLLITP